VKPITVRDLPVSIHRKVSGLKENLHQLKSDLVNVKRTLALAAALPRFFHDDRGQTRVTLVVHPSTRELNEGKLLARLQQGLACGYLLPSNRETLSGDAEQFLSVVRSSL